jgi:hypothetical protein
MSIKVTLANDHRCVVHVWDLVCHIAELDYIVSPVSARKGDPASGERMAVYLDKAQILLIAALQHRLRIAGLDRQVGSRLPIESLGWNQQDLSYKQAHPVPPPRRSRQEESQLFLLSLTQ